VNLTQLEQELIWLTKKVNADEDRINRAEDYFDEHQREWSRGVLATWLNTIEQMKDQLYYEQHRLEMLAWQLVEAREGRSTDLYDQMIDEHVERLSR
jgi:hypothetical protein